MVAPPPWWWWWWLHALQKRFEVAALLAYCAVVLLLMGQVVRPMGACGSHLPMLVALQTVCGVAAAADSCLATPLGDLLSHSSILPRRRHQLQRRHRQTLSWL